MTYSIKSGTKYHDHKHRAVPTPMPPANKLIQAKIEARNRRILARRVKNVKGVVDVSVPDSFRYGRVNAKKIKIQEDRLHQIDVANTHLVDRMVSIAEGKGSVDSHLKLDPSFSIPVSMNIKSRVKEVERIERENWIIKKRLDKVTGSYSREFPESKTKAGGKKGDAVQTNKGGQRMRPTRPSALSPSPRGRKRMANNFLPLFTIGTRLGELHVKMNIYDKRDGTVRIMIYEPLSSRQYPMDLDKDKMCRIVGEEGADLLTSKTAEAKLMWKNFASHFTLRPVSDEQAHVFKLVVDSADSAVSEKGAFQIVETEFEFADPTKAHEPHKHDAALKIQARFRGDSARRLAAELEVRKSKQTGRKRKKGSPKQKRRKSPERKFAEKAEIEMIETYNAQSVIAKHVKGHLARKRTIEMKRERVASAESATVIQAAIRKKKARKIVREKKEQNDASVKLQGLVRKKKAKKVVQEKKEQKEASVKLQGLVRKKNAKKIVQEKKEQKDASIKLQGLARKKKAKKVVQEKKEQKEASVKLQGMVRQKKAKGIVQEKKEQRSASIKLQKLARQKKARATVARKRAESEEVNLSRLKEEHAEAEKIKERAREAELERIQREKAEAKAKQAEEEEQQRIAKEEEEKKAKAEEEAKAKAEEEAKAKAEEEANVKAAEEGEEEAQAAEKAKATAEVERAKMIAEETKKVASVEVASEFATAIADVTRMVEKSRVMDKAMTLESIVHDKAEEIVESAIRMG
eukprot:CAMPEP_0118667690 /NCGR_PEP_ID=MMETSP0785-20121206/19931_1 /TAXON_ID=91992 /ORGANISM="Bolidomonas pacifica, Strain CCMP 1866" /LENGTH=746 /DNA_ID=CAMNT_0006562181 /DNA_START=43 /DNA_END=2280 /DNA_ORIENTATION=-